MSGSFLVCLRRSGCAGVAGFVSLHRMGIVQRVLALTAVIWHNDRTGQSIKRSLVAYDH